MPSRPAAPFRNAKNVTVSVVVTSHNYGHFLERCIRSVADQTFRDWELIVVDDGSTDDTVEVARRCVQLCGDRQVVILSTRQGGVSRARNLGISAARGTYVSCLDADDSYYPSALERMVAEFEIDPSLGVVSSPVDGDEISGGMWGHRPYSFEKLREACLITSCAMFRRDAWRRVGGYDEEMTGYEDWDYWITLGAAGYPMKCLREILWHYRVRPDGKYYTQSRPRDLELRARIVRNHPDVYSDCCRELAERIAEGPVTDDEVFACSHPMFSGSFRTEAAIGRAEEADPDEARKDDEPYEPSTVLMAQPCLVPFQDCSRRVGGVGWAQQIQWRSIRGWLSEGRGEPDGLRLSAEVPAGTSVDDFLAALTRLVSRHESLRTKFRSANGRLVRQEAVEGGYIDVTRYRVRAGHTPTIELLQERLGDEPLDFENGFPFRAGYVAAEDVVTHGAFFVSRLIADAAGCQNLVASFLAELAAVTGDERGATAPTAPAFQQLDQVAWESAADGRRAESLASDHWREQLAVIRTLPRPAMLDNGAVRSVEMPAESILAAAHEVARASGTSSSGVLLTAFLHASAQTLALDGVGCYLQCSNRSDAQRQHSITRLKNLTVFTYSADGSDFRTAVRTVFQDSLKAYRHAQSPGELFLPRMGMTPADDAPFTFYNDVRTIVPMDGPIGSPRQEAAEPQTDPVKLAVPGARLGYSPIPVLSLGVGAIMGSSKKPVLKLEANVLHTDGLLLLLERMNHVLTTAAATSPATSSAESSAGSDAVSTHSA
jgi:hypothetical protein